MDLWRLLAPYLVAGILVAFFVWVIVRSLRAKPPLSPPMMVHLTIAMGMAFILLLVLIDTRRIEDVPAFRWRGKLIAFEKRLGTVETAVFEGLNTEEFLIKDAAETGVKIETAADDHDYPWRLTLPLKREPVPNTVQSWENGVGTEPRRVSVQGTMLTLKMYYEPGPSTDVVVRYYTRSR